MTGNEREFSIDIEVTEAMIAAGRNCLLAFTHWQKMLEKKPRDAMGKRLAKASCVIAEKTYGDNFDALTKAIYADNPQLKSPIFSQREETKIIVTSCIESLLRGAAEQLGLKAPDLSKAAQRPR
jgi:hypothetical protein